MKKTPLKRIGKRGSEKNRKYKKARDEYFLELAIKQGRKGEEPLCQICHVFTARECHHMAGRSGSYRTDKRFFLAVCSGHHRQITDFPQWALKLGYTVLRGDPVRMLADVANIRKEMEEGR